MKVTIVSNLFSPDVLGGASLYTDLVDFLSTRGCTVNVVSTFPYYPEWRLASSDSGVWDRVDYFNGYRVRRLGMYVPARASGIKRLISDMSFATSLSIMGAEEWQDSDVVLTACPMMGQMLAVRLSGLRQPRPSIAIVQDFVVDAALELGMLKGPGLRSALELFERWVFDGFDHLTSISPEMTRKLANKVSEPHTVSFVPNWIHGSLQSAIDTQIEGSRHRKRRKGVLFYSGNVGKKQGLPDFIECFNGRSNGWSLDITGGGAELSRLKEVCKERTDISLGPLREESAYIESLLDCSACLITQMPGVGANFLPSKILPALASGTPILAVCEHSSPLGREVIEGMCGAVVSPGNREELNAVLVDWKDNPDLLAELSRNARRRSLMYHREQVLGELLALMQLSTKRAGRSVHV